MHFVSTYFTLIFYTPNITPRIEYMAAWLGRYLFGKEMIATSQTPLNKDEELVFNYSNQKLTGIAFQIIPSGLLTEKKISPQKIEIIKKGNDNPYFFATNGDHPFDILSAAFYLMQRYEEYLPHIKDKFGLYAHENSLAFQNNFLKMPLVDLWMEDLKHNLQVFFAKRNLQFLTGGFLSFPALMWTLLLII